MTHQQMVDAVRASELLAPTTSERHGIYRTRKLTPGEERMASENDMLRERGSLSPAPSQAVRPEETGRDGRGVPPTPRLIPGTRKHV
jgi:hypothetical protein